MAYPDSEDPASEDERAAAAPQAITAAPREKTARGFVLSWKQGLFWVPADAVVSPLPKTPYMVEDGAALGALLNTRTADRWLPVCHPQHLVLLKGKEGKSCYAIFGVQGQDNEQRFIRNVPGPVCAKNFVFPQSARTSK